MIRAAALPLALLAALAMPAAAQEAAEDRVVTTGQRLPDMTLERATQRFVAEVAAPAAGSQFGAPRWGRAICVGVQNVAPDRAQFLVGRMSQVAMGLGVRPGEPGCSPNIVIAFAADGAELASAWVKADRRRFRPYGGTGGTNAGLRALGEFRRSAAPVRVWCVTAPVDELGEPAIADKGLTGGPATVKGSGFFLSRRLEDRMLSASIVVDVNLLDGATWPQLADYLAMTALVRIDPEAATAGYDTILNLFDGPESAPRGLTDWDRAFLRAVYDFDQTRAPGLQGGEIAAIMARDRDIGGENGGE